MIAHLTDPGLTVLCVFRHLFQLSGNASLVKGYSVVNRTCLRKTFLAHTPSSPPLRSTSFCCLPHVLAHLSAACTHRRNAGSLAIKDHGALASAVLPEFFKKSTTVKSFLRQVCQALTGSPSLDGTHECAPNNDQAVSKHKSMAPLTRKIVYILVMTR